MPEAIGRPDEIVQPHPKTLAAIEALGIVAQVVECKPDWADTANFCAHYSQYLPEQCANTLIVATRTDPVQFVACLVLSTHKIVNQKVNKLVGTRHHSFASEGQMTEVSEMIKGGVTLVGLPDDMPKYVDAAVLEQPEIVMGGGNLSSKLVLDPQELRKLPELKIIEGLAKLRPQA